jgi:hypothetical protein
MLLLQTNVGTNLDAFVVSFGYSLSSRQTCSLGDQISCAASMWPVGHQCGAAPARVEEAQGAKVVSVKSETQKGTS